MSGFRLDENLVTVGRFRKFVAASVAGWIPAAGSGKHTHLNGGRGLGDSGGSGYEPGWDPRTPPRAGDDGSRLDGPVELRAVVSNLDATRRAPHETLPLNCVDWYEAYAFCIWDGGFLPSEAEWEYAAAGGDELREYPWGSTAPGTAPSAEAGPAST